MLNLASRCFSCLRHHAHFSLPCYTEIHMTFSEEQQQRARDLFIEECRQNAWGAACNADWIGKQHDELLAQYEKLKKSFSHEAEALLATLATRKGARSIE